MPKLDRSAGDILIWLLLMTAPYWLPAAGSYVELGTRVVVFGLAATALNFLLGYTGVLSFGHAAYFGLGAYGTALTIKFLVASTPVGMLVGVVVGTIAAAIHSRLRHPTAAGMAAAAMMRSTRARTVETCAIASSIGRGFTEEATSSRIWA